MLHKRLHEDGIDLALAAELLQQKNYSKVDYAEKKDYYPCSSQQRRLYILQQLDPNSMGYNEVTTLFLSERPDIDRLRETFKKAIQRHETLRTSFDIVDEVPVQRIHPKVEFEIEYYRLSKTVSGIQGSKNIPDFEQVMRTFVRPFDLSQAPLFRVGLIEIEESRFFLILDEHHIITDGISHTLLTKELLQSYYGHDLPAMQIQYKEYAEWQGKRKGSPEWQRQESFWLQEFSGEIPVLQLPIDFPRPQLKSFEGGEVDCIIASEMTSRIRALSQSEDATLYLVLLAMYYVFLSKLSCQEDIVVGSMVSGRRRVEFEKVLGMFVNTIALRNYPENGKTFRAFLQEVKKKTLKAFDNQDYQYEDLVNKVHMRRDQSRNPLFDATFELKNFLGVAKEPSNNARSQNANHQSEHYEYQTIASKFDLSLSVIENRENLFLTFEYSSQLFKRETIERFVGCFRKIALTVSENPDLRISEIEILSARERKQLLEEFNDTDAVYPQDKTIQEFFEGQVKKTPDSIAIIFEDQQLSYGLLNQRANQLARKLRDWGVKPDSIVGMMIERSIEMFIGILAVVKSGGAYMPIDPAYPLDRKLFSIKDSGTSVLLIQSELAGANPEVIKCFGHDKVFNLDDESIYSGNSGNLTNKNNPENLIYAIYTSGTTGRPKGVLVEHRNVVNLVNWFGPRYEVRRGMHVIQLTDYTFDPFVEEVFGSLSYGGTVFIAAKVLYSEPERFASYVETRQIEMANVVPAVLRILFSGERLKSLRVIITGGERLDEATRDYILQRGYKLYNHYGPTETTVDALTWECTLGRVMIGRPIGNCCVHVVDGYGGEQPIGVKGELVIGGAGVSRGYLNQPELTAAAFTESFFAGGKRLYKSGDIGRWRSDGTIEYLGRVDGQVKLRGYRIELGEVESAVLGHVGVREAVVVAGERGEGDKYLCAYVVGAADLAIEELREYLRGRLPEYMVPGFYVRMARLPLTENGKIDRRSLPLPELERDGEHVGARDDLELGLVGLWSEVLGIAGEVIGIERNFFEMGGHSLKAAILVAKVEKTLGIKIPLVEIFAKPTIKQLAEYIRYNEMEIKHIDDDKLVILKYVNANEENLFLVHDGTGSVEGYIEFCNQLNSGFNCWGIRADSFEGLGPQNLTIEKLAKKYIQKIRKVQPRGPYCIGGWSIGGTIAFEMVRQLERRKEAVDFLAMIDVVAPDIRKSKVVRRFTVQSEIKWLRKYLSLNNGVFNHSGRIDQLWSGIAEYLESNNYDVGAIRRIVVEVEALKIPAYAQLSIRELLRFTNLVRTLSNARNSYLPAGKIHTRVHHFIASKSYPKIRNLWKPFAKQPIEIHKIDGDHYSILQAEKVNEIATIFNDVLTGRYQ